jgi:hypothetical protein
MEALRTDVYKSVDGLALWSDWAPFAVAAPVAPTTPGVYQLRLPDKTIVYVGMAGERKGNGLRGRLSIYRRGKGAVSGFGEAALDRALANPAFVEDHLEAIRSGNPARASRWAQDAIQWFNVDIRWAVCATRADALALETSAVELLKPHLIWNRIATRVPRSRVPAKTHGSPESDVREKPIVGSGSVETVSQLAELLGEDEKRIRRTLRAGFPEHVKRSLWDPLSADQVAHVLLARSRGKSART